jgi:hypothetical protein
MSDELLVFQASILLAGLDGEGEDGCGKPLCTPATKSRLVEGNGRLGIKLLSSSLPHHGGEIEEDLEAEASLCWGLPLPERCYSSEINQAAGELAVAIQGREDGNSTTSDAEAMARLRRGCSMLLSCEVIRSPQDGGGSRLRVFVGRGLPSSWLSFLGGDALRTPATSGRDTLVLDCFDLVLSRVFFCKV